MTPKFKPLAALAAMAGAFSAVTTLAPTAAHAAPLPCGTYDLATFTSTTEVLCGDKLFTDFKDFDFMVTTNITFSYSKPQHTIDFDFPTTLPDGTYLFKYKVDVMSMESIIDSTSTVADNPAGTATANYLLTDMAPIYSYQWELDLPQGTTATGWTQTITQTPGPLPILGAGAAFGFSRKLRRRIKTAA